MSELLCLPQLAAGPRAAAGAPAGAAGAAAAAPPNKVTSPLDLLSIVATESAPNRGASAAAAQGAPQAPQVVRAAPCSPPSDAEGSHGSTPTAPLPAYYGSSSPSPPTSESEGETDASSPGRGLCRKRAREAGIMGTADSLGVVSGSSSASAPVPALAAHRLPHASPTSPMCSLPPYAVGGPAGAGTAAHAMGPGHGKEPRAPWIDLRVWEQQQKEQQQAAAGASYSATAACLRTLQQPQEQEQERKRKRKRMKQEQPQLSDVWATGTAGGLAITATRPWVAPAPATLASTVGVRAAAAAPAPVAAAPAPAPARVAVPAPAGPLPDAVAEAIALASESLRRGIALLAARQRLSRARVEAMRALIMNISRVHGQECTAGVAPFLAQLLQTQPQAFYTAPNLQRAQAAALGAPGSGKVRVGQRPESEPEAVLRRLALDDSACCVMATLDRQGGASVVCSRRMEELFLSTEEYKGALAGVLPMLLWPLFVCAGPGLDELYAAVVSVLFDPLSRSQLDVIVECRTRQGSVVRGLATVGLHVSPCKTGTFSVLRILPCLVRNFGPAPGPGRGAH